MNDQHMNNVAALIIFFVCVAFFMMLCNQIDSIIKSRRALKYKSKIKVGCVITKKIPEPDYPNSPHWANMRMENRVTGEVRPVSADETGFWYFGGNGTEPQNLSLKEWFIKDYKNGE